MQIAAFIFLASGLSYLGWILTLVFTQGVSVDLLRVLSLLMALVFGAALLFQAYELFRNKPGAWWRATISSGAITVASGYIASTFVLFQFPRNILELPAEVCPVFGGAVVVCLAHAAVVVLLAMKKLRPNHVVERTP